MKESLGEVTVHSVTLSCLSRSRYVVGATHRGHSAAIQVPSARNRCMSGIFKVSTGVRKTSLRWDWTNRSRLKIRSARDASVAI